MDNPLTVSNIKEATKLYGDNYVKWKFKMQILMDEYNFGSISRGDELKQESLQKLQLHQFKIGKGKRLSQNIF